MEKRVNVKGYRMDIPEQAKERKEIDERNGTITPNRDQDIAAIQADIFKQLESRDINKRLERLEVDVSRIAESTARLVDIESTLLMIVKRSNMVNTPESKARRLT